MTTTHEPAALSADSLTFGYDHRPVLKDVSLSIRVGEFFGIIGPNGSGKSTLLSVLSGLIPPTDGRVLVFDRPLKDMPRMDIARMIGMVSQSPEIAAGFTVLETVLAGRYPVSDGRFFDSQEDEAAANESLARTGLAELSGRPAGELSGGERQRLALARVLAIQPRILLLDEATSALDLDHQLRVMTLVEDACQRQDLAVGFVSHDLNLASLYSHRLLLLKDGRPLAVGSPEEVITSELLRHAYGVDVLVDEEPFRGRPRVTLAPAGVKFTG